MGVDYLLRCAICYSKIEDMDYPDEMTADDYDEEWERLYEKLDPDFGFGWGIVSVPRLFKWLNIHKEHGKIEFTAE